MKKAQRNDHIRIEFITFIELIVNLQTENFQQNYIDE